MARKKTQQPLHIKSHTHGSSNEISFSVLDAAREARDAEERERRRSRSVTGKIPLFTLGSARKPRATPTKGQHIVIPEGVKGPSPRASVPSRPATSSIERKIPRVVTTLVIVCVLVALALTAGQTFLQVNARQHDYRSQLINEIGVVNQCDQTLIPFDELVMAQYDAKRFDATGTRPSFDELTKTYREVVGDIAPSRTQLEDALAAIEALQPSLSDNRDKEAAYQAVTAARSRLNMLESGVAIIDESLMATKAFTEVGDGWKKIIDADAAAREATSLLREMNTKNVKASAQKSNEAISLLSEANTLFTQAQSGYPQLNVQAFIDYIAKRDEAQRMALSADQAYLDRDKEQLEKTNAKYNELEQQAADLAEAMGENPDQKVADLYYQAIESDAKAYEEERVKAGNADMFLRDYLGSTSE